jgi:hypothetical protein
MQMENTIGSNSKSCPKACLQEHVGGHITSLPCSQASALVAYARDDGLMDPKFARNDLAGGALSELGFGGHEMLGFAYAGSVVVVGNTRSGKDRGLTEKECERLQQAILTYRKKMNQDDEDAEDGDE